VGVVGVLDDASFAVGAAFRAAGDAVLVAGDGPAALDGSAHQRVVDGTTEGRIPEPDLAGERRLHEFLAAAAERRLLRSAHDVSDGGVAIAIAESAILGAIGVDAPDPGEPFTEGDGRAVISALPEHVGALEALAGELPLRRVGTAGGERIAVAGAAIDLAEATGLYEGAIPRALGEEAAD
jgi:phosphoribosylformylglycinamidine synthase subunit PurL